MNEHRQSYELFAEKRNASLVLPKGPLGVIATEWVETERTIWALPGNWKPRKDGGSGLVVTAALSDELVVDGQQIDGPVFVFGPEEGEPSRVTFGENIRAEVIGSNGAYALRIWDSEADAVRRFGRVDSFTHNPDWIIQGTWRGITGQTYDFDYLKPGGNSKKQEVPGQISFDHSGETYSVVAFRAGSALQLVFADATNGKTSYSVGRFLFIAPGPGETITLDFNYAILPPCAFSFAFNCPLPPPQNRFPFLIEAGEKNVLDLAGDLLHG